MNKLPSDTLNHIPLYLIKEYNYRFYHSIKSIQLNLYLKNHFYISTYQNMTIICLSQWSRSNIKRGKVQNMMNKYNDKQEQKYLNMSKNMDYQRFHYYYQDQIQSLLNESLNQDLKTNKHQILFSQSANLFMEMILIIKFSYFYKKVRYNANYIRSKDQILQMLMISLTGQFLLQSLILSEMYKFNKLFVPFIWLNLQCIQHQLIFHQQNLSNLHLGSFKHESHLYNQLPQYYFNLFLSRCQSHKTLQLYLLFSIHNKLIMAQPEFELHDIVQGLNLVLAEIS